MSAGWTALTAEFEGRQYAGAYQVVGDEVHVVGDAGSRQARLSQADHVRTRAEQLLLDIYAPPGWPPRSDSTWEPQPAAHQPPAPAKAKPDNRVGLALLAAFLVSGATLLLASPGRSPFTFAFVLLGWLLAVMAHEFGHALVAYHAGDRTVRAKGYLSFDPRRYADLTVTLVLPIVALAMGGIGFPGGAVYLRQDLMRGPLWRAAASLGGPAATLAVLLVLAAGLAVARSLGATGMLFNAVAMLAFLQATALILNLLPFPGLDGFNAIRPFLPRAWAKAIRKVEGVSMIVLLIALLIIPGVGDSLFRAAVGLAAGVGVPRAAMQGGWDAFHFWR